MSSLKEDIHINDFLMDKVSKQMYFVVSIGNHEALLRLEGDGDNRPVEEKPKHYINKFLIKVNPETIKLLYQGDLKKGDDSSGVDGSPA